LFVVVQGYLSQLLVVQGYGSSAPLVPLPGGMWIEPFRGEVWVEVDRELRMIEPQRGNVWRA
jgi:hypothetical protein